MNDKPLPMAWKYCPITGEKLVTADDGQGPRPYSVGARRFYYSNPVPAACCFVTKGDAILFVQRSVEPRKGLWTVPGGFVEVGETPEQAALRELEEETALIGERAILLGVRGKPHRDAGGVIVIAYRVPEWSGELVAATDAMDAAFFGPGERPPMAFDAHVELLADFDRWQAANRGG